MKFQYLKVNDNCIYLYDEYNLEVIVSCLDEIFHVTLLQKEEDGVVQSWVLYCLTQSGKLFRLCRDEVVNSKSKPSKSEDNQKIFSELLSDDEELDEEEDNFGIKLEFCAKPVYQFETCHQIQQFTSTVRGLCVTDSVITIITECEQGYTVILYENKENFKDEFSLNEEYKTLNFQYVAKENKRQRGSYKVLIKTANKFQNSAINIYSTDVVTLDQNVSKVLFWMEPVLLNAPILLLCPPQGSVYFTSTHSFHLHPKQNNTMIVRNTKLMDDNPWKLLCDTGTQVFDILQISLSSNSEPFNQSTTPDTKNALAVCCRGGQVFFFMASCDMLEDSGISEVQVSDIILTGPLVALCGYNCRLYHCTDKLMYETSLAVSVAEGTQRHVVTITQTKMYKHAGVLGLFCSHPEDSINHKDAPCILTCATARGEIKKIRSTEFSDNICPVSSGQIRDVLLAMDKLDTERQMLHSALQKQDSLLKQINIAGYLMQQHCMNIKKTDCKEDDLCLLPCQCEARLCTQYSEREIQMCVKVTNQTGVSLSHDWKFVLTLIPVEPNLLVSNVTSVTQTLKDDFKPGASFTITAKIESELLLPGLTVSLTAILDLAHQMNTTPYLEQEKDTDSTNILSAQIYSQCTDILFFVLPDNFESQQMCLDWHGSESTRRTILKIAEGRPMASMFKDDVKLEKGATANASQAGDICLSHSIRMKERTYKHLQKQYSKGLCCILQYLLRDSPSSQPKTGSDCSLLSMLGHQVYLSVVKVTTVALETSVNSVDFEVKIRGEPSIAAAVHAAVVRRTKVLQDELCFPETGVTEMKKKLYKLQELQDDMQSYSQTRETKTDLMTFATFYERLRSLQIS